MSILVDIVRISGFRGIANLEMTLPRVAVLIGANNSGKTSVIKALQLGLGDYSRYLSEEDFYIDAEDNSASEILVDVRVVPIGEDGLRIVTFDDDWTEEFGDRIQAEADGGQYLAIRTKGSRDTLKGGFSVERFSLEKWPDFNAWRDEKTSIKRQVRKRFDSMPFISIDAQRDIHLELREKSSFVGKVLSGVEYQKEDIEKIEKLVAGVNDEAVKKSKPLMSLKTHLEDLNKSFNGSGHAEITPFPKKIRDLSKQFTVHFGEKSVNSFSMEYHGMGTRSWASMLTVKAFSQLMAEKHEEEASPFSPILAAEEPEAHLHPNAQRSIYKQLIESHGQVIISTHSPYLAAMADQSELRVLSSKTKGVSSAQLTSDLDPDDKRKLQREVVHSRGELLFSKAIVLSEGETEEQALPELFKKYIGEDAFTLGINFIGVGGSGAKYKPYLIFARDFNIPVFIFSDGEEKTKKDLKKHYEEVFEGGVIEGAPNITILDGTDFEGYLLDSGFEQQMEDAISAVEHAGYIDKFMKRRQGAPIKPVKTDQPPCSTCKQPIFEAPLRDYSGANGRRKAIAEIIDSKKPLYAKVVTEELCKLDAENIPQKMIDLFEKIKASINP
jgi:putative ATP-dependent endonuclease of the OLD family